MRIILTFIASNMALHSCQIKTGAAFSEGRRHKMFKNNDLRLYVFFVTLVCPGLGACGTTRSGAPAGDIRVEKSEIIYSSHDKAEPAAFDLYAFDLEQLAPLVDKIGPTEDEIAAPLTPDEIPKGVLTNAFRT